MLSSFMPRLELETPDSVAAGSSTLYNLPVARGWESKSVEEQQAEAATTLNQPKPQLSPAQLARQRQREGLALSRKHLLQQLDAAQNPRHREMLQAALADLDAQIAQLG